MIKIVTYPNKRLQVILGEEDKSVLSEYWLIINQHVAREIMDIKEVVWSAVKMEPNIVKGENMDQSLVVDQETNGYVRASVRELT